MNWLMFALMTVVTWGVYGVFLHTGQMGMRDAVNGRYKAFLFVGLAYFLTAVLAPLTILVARGADWNYPKHGMTWSLVAGIAGALGAFCVLLAFGAKGTPPVVMSIVFAGAPVVNAPSSVSFTESTTVTVNVTASDPNGDPITSLSADLTSLPAVNDAVFVKNGTNTAGTLTWHTTRNDGRTAPYPVTFTASNALTGTATTAWTPAASAALVPTSPYSLA